MFISSVSETYVSFKPFKNGDTLTKVTRDSICSEETRPFSKWTGRLKSGTMLVDKRQPILGWKRKDLSDSYSRKCLFTPPWETPFWSVVNSQELWEPMNPRWNPRATSTHHESLGILFKQLSLFPYLWKSSDHGGKEQLWWSSQRMVNA